MGELAVKFHGTQGRREWRRRAVENRRTIAARGGNRGHLHPPQTCERLADECPAALALWVRVGGGNEIYYRVGSDCNDVGRDVNCWLYPCGDVSSDHDTLLLTLEGYEVEIGARRDGGRHNQSTRNLIVRVRDPRGPDGQWTDLWEGSADCVSSHGGGIVPVRRAWYTGVLSRMN